MLEDNPLGRYVLFDQARKAAKKATGGNYPAVPAIIDCVEAGANNGWKAYDVESKKFGELSETSVHSAMLGMFNGMTALKKNRFGKPAKPAETIGVLGAGLMGAGVAQVTSQKAKNRVLLKDLNQAGLSRGIQQVEGNLATALKRRKMDAFTKNTTMARIVGLTEDDPTWPKQFEKCDLVVEAVLEELSLKHRVIEQVEQCTSVWGSVVLKPAMFPLRRCRSYVLPPTPTPLPSPHIHPFHPPPTPQISLSMPFLRPIPRRCPSATWPRQASAHRTCWVCTIFRPWTRCRSWKSSGTREPPTRPALLPWTSASARERP